MFKYATSRYIIFCGNGRPQCFRHFSLFLIGACSSRGMSREIIQKSNLPGDSAEFPERFGRIPCLGEKT